MNAQIFARYLRKESIMMNKENYFWRGNIYIYIYIVYTYIYKIHTHTYIYLYAFICIHTHTKYRKQRATQISKFIFSEF